MTNIEETKRFAAEVAAIIKYAEGNTKESAANLFQTQMTKPSLIKRMKREILLRLQRKSYLPADCVEPDSDGKQYNLIRFEDWSTVFYEEDVLLPKGVPLLDCMKVFCKAFDEATGCTKSELKIEKEYMKVLIIKIIV